MERRVIIERFTSEKNLSNPPVTPSKFKKTPTLEYFSLSANSKKEHKTVKKDEHWTDKKESSQTDF